MQHYRVIILSACGYLWIYKKIKHAKCTKMYKIFKVKMLYYYEDEISLYVIYNSANTNMLIN